jgi:hypothetical protein
MFEKSFMVNAPGRRHDIKTDDSEHNYTHKLKCDTQQRTTLGTMSGIFDVMLTVVYAECHCFKCCT